MQFNERTCVPGRGVLWSCLVFRGGRETRSWFLAASVPQCAYAGGMDPLGALVKWVQSAEIPGSEHGAEHNVTLPILPSCPTFDPQLRIHETSTLSALCA
jgi:hypothetical protein